MINRRPTAIGNTVKRLKAVIAMLMLALLLPATSHELLERAGLIHQEASDSASGGDHDAADGVFLSSSNGFQIQTTHCDVGLPTACLLPCAWMFPIADPPLRQASLEIPGPSPPHLAKGWQFVFRAALPVRAPSFLS